MCVGRGISHVSRQFVKPVPDVANGAEFDHLDENAHKDYELLDYAKDDVNPMQELWNNKGYQPYEPLKGFVEGPGKVVFRRPENRLNIQRRGYFGQCTDLPYMGLMDSLDT